MNRRRRLGGRAVAVAAAAVTAATGLAGCGSPPGPASTVRSFLAAWDRSDYAAMASLTDHPPAGFEAAYRQEVSALGVTSARHDASKPAGRSPDATVAVTSHLTLAGFGPLDVPSTLHLHLTSGRWLVEWSPEAIADRLGPGDHLALERKWPARAQVLGAGGASLTPPGVKVGLVGSRITNPAQLASVLTGAGFPAGSVSAAVAAATAHPTQLVPLGVIPLATYQALKAQPGTNLYTAPGTAFTQGAQAPLTPELGVHLLGSVGPVTAEQLRSLGAPYTASAEVGQGGIEGRYERTLAGSPAQTVAVEDAKGKTVATLGSRPSTPGTAVKTSIDPRVQAAAEAAMAGLPPTTQAAMVVERASTGEILAVVSRPETTAFDVALEGQVPPGSTFKVITTTALLGAGDSASTPATCPQTLDVNGQVFHNFEGEASPNLDIAQAFAQSCNTAFIGLAGKLPGGSALVAAAADYGIGTTPHPGVGVAGSTTGKPSTPNEVAATAIGQGGVVVSPLTMASVAATVDSGSYHPPRLVAGAPDDTAPDSPLPPGVSAALRPLMAAVVTSGTAAGAHLPAGTFGKTGTAEFGPGPNPPTHAWFVGFRGDLAFSVFVYGGGVGGAVAAPLAAKLLGALPGG